MLGVAWFLVRGCWLLKCLNFCVGASDVLCSYVDNRQLPPNDDFLRQQHELPSASARARNHVTKKEKMEPMLWRYDPTIVSHRRPLSPPYYSPAHKMHTSIAQAS